MPKVRVFTNPDGSVRVMRLNERRLSRLNAARRPLPGETDDQFFARETAKQPELAALPFVDMDPAEIPANRSRRHAWRMRSGKLVVDATVPDLPPPRQTLLDEIDRALTLDDLKAALRKMTGSGGVR